MRFFARICALLLCVTMLLPLCACHKKGEIVMTIGDVEIPSGLYLSFLSESFNEFAQHKDIADAVGDASLVSADDYFDFELAGKDAVTWIKDRTKEFCIEYATVVTLFKEYDLSLTDAEKEYIDYYVDSYWEQGYDEYFEANGISKESYRTTLEFFTMKNLIFTYYYDEPNEETGKGGIEEVPMSELLTQLGKDYMLLETISISKEITNESGSPVSKTDVQIAEDKAKLSGYASRINSGSATFDQCKKEYDAENGNATTDTPAADVAEEEGALKSIYPETARLLSVNDTDANGNSNSAEYDLYYELKEDNKIPFGTATLLDQGNESLLIIFYDISKDEYYGDQCRSTLLQTLKEDDFDKILSDKGATLTVSVKDSLVKYYSPKKLVLEPEE